MAPRYEMVVGMEKGHKATKNNMKVKNKDSTQLLDVNTLHGTYFLRGCPSASLGFFLPCVIYFPIITSLSSFLLCSRLQVFSFLLMQ